MTSEVRKVLVLGALSAVARATSRRLAARGAAFYLVARDGDTLEREAADLKVRGAYRVDTLACDLTQTSECDWVVSAAAGKMEGLDTVFVFYGLLGDQRRAEQDQAEAARIIDVNYTSAALWIMAAARELENSAKGRGVLIAASSVAGDRGRASNYLYGSAKAGLSVLMQGLAHKWARRNDAPRAVTLKLGFVDSPMTDGLEKTGPLWSNPEVVAKIAERAVTSGGPTVYGPWFWRVIMLAIRVTPHFIFKRIEL